MRTTTLTLTVLLCLSAGAARAEQNDADAYCTFVRGTAASQSSLLYSPQLYTRYSYINGDQAAGVGVGGTLSRFQLGVRYNISELYQGVLTGGRAKADCGRYRALSQLNAFLEASRELESRPALSAKVQVLQEAMPRATEILRAAQAAAAGGYVTVEQLNATQLRVDALKAQLAEAKQALEIALQRPAPPRSIPALQRARDAAERDVERAEARLRRATGWELTVAGGYDRLFGVRDQLPLFVLVQASFKPGWFAQHHYDHQALEGRLAWEHLDPAGADQRAEAVMRQFGAIAHGETERLQQTSVLIADLEKRLKAVEGMEGPHAKEFRDYLWFDLVRLRAEAAYLEAHVRELQSYRGGRS